MNRTRLRIILSAILLTAACSQNRRETSSARVPSEQSTVQAAPTEVVNEQLLEEKAWSVQLVQRVRGPKDSDAILVDLSLLEPTGNRRLLAKDLIGPVFVLERERKIVSCEANDVVTGDNPIIIDIGGRKVDGPKHPGYLRRCGQVEDSGLAFFHYNLVRGGAPYNLVRIVDSDRKVVVEKELLGAGDIEVHEENKMYQIHVAEPELPG